MTGRSALALAVAAAIPLPAAASGPVLITVTGAVTSAKHGSVDPLRDRLFVSTDIGFERAHGFSPAALQAPPQTTVDADFPMGGAVAAFAGPSFEALVDAAWASGDTVMVQAIDGYMTEISRDELAAIGATLALEMDGEALAIGSLGPAMVAYPRAEREDLAAMNDDTWAWEIFHIRVE